MEEIIVGYDNLSSLVKPKAILAKNTTVQTMDTLFEETGCKTQVCLQLQSGIPRSVDEDEDREKLYGLVVDQALIR